MHSQTDRGQKGRLQRAQRALGRMLDFQKTKARKFAENGIDPTRHLLAKAHQVRSRLETFQPIESDTRVLEVGSGAHGLVFFFGASRSVGIDPLAHHYVTLFPAWQRNVPTVSGFGEALPFPDNSFDLVLSDDGVDYAEDPAAIIAEIKRVLVPGGKIFFAVNICHPVWNTLGSLREVRDFHTTHISLRRARDFFRRAGFGIVWESHDIPETRALVGKRRERRFQAWVKSLFYYKARLELIAIKEGR